MASPVMHQSLVVDGVRIAPGFHVEFEYNDKWRVGIVESLFTAAGTGNTLLVVYFGEQAEPSHKSFNVDKVKGLSADSSI